MDGPKAVSGAGWAEAQVGENLPGLGFVLGAGDGNRTRTVSLGIADHRPVGPPAAWLRWSEVASVAPSCPGAMARQWHDPGLATASWTTALQRSRGLSADVRSGR
jgi:hypothetical protein